MAVVVGYVPTPEGRAALISAAREARLRRVRLVVISSHRDDKEKDTDQSAAYAEELHRVLEDLTANGVDHEIRHVAGGPEPADDLLAAAEQTSAEVIVIGLRRRTPVGKLILGSNAQRVLLDAPCPVLAVKPDQLWSPG